MSQSPMDNLVEMENKAQPHSKLPIAFDTSLNASNYGGSMNVLSPSVVINTQTSPQAISRLKCDDTSCNKIFVGGLSWDTTQEKLYEYFSKFGSIIDCILMLDGTTGRSRGFGFVTFLQQESVKSVLSVKQHILDSKIIDPKEAVPKYIKDIENRVNSSQQQSSYHTSINNYGCVNGCGGGANNSISVAVATPNTSITHTNGGAKSSTKPSLSRRSSCVGGDQVSLPTNSLSCQHISPAPSSCFLCPNVVHNTKIFVGGIGHASETDLREYFSTFGTVVDVNIMMDKSTGRPRGFAFIGFSTSEAADLTASMRYHCVRNKQVEVKKALPKDTKYLSASNHSNTAVSENHPLPSSKINSLASKNSFKGYNNTLSYDYQLHTINNTKLNATFDESIVSHDPLHISTATITPVGTTNCSLLSAGSAVGNDDPTATSILHSAAYGGEWDFDDVVHFDDPKSGTTFSNNIIGTNSPLHQLPTTPCGILINNTNQTNVPFHSLKNYMGDSINGGASLNRHDNALFELSNNRSTCYRRHQGCSSVFDTHHNSNVASACNPPVDRLQPMRFNSVGDTTTLLNRQIPDDTKNSIVELLNEIWKGNG